MPSSRLLILLRLLKFFSISQSEYQNNTFQQGTILIVLLCRQVTTLPLQLCESEKAIKRKPGAQGYNWATLSLRDIIAGASSSRTEAEHKAEDLAL